jgi:hypothetical protein
MSIQATRLILAAAAALLAAGCGVKGDPHLADERGDDHPRTYPRGAIPNEDRPENIFVDRRR